MNKRNPDLEIASLSQALRNTQQSWATRGLMLGICGVFTALACWSAFAKVDSLTRAQGQVIPSARMQLIQNLEGGIVRKIHVKQGDTVEAGALIVSLSPTQFSGELGSREQQMLAVTARIARLTAESTGKEPSFPKALRKSGAVFVATELAEFQGRRARVAAEQAMFASQIQQRLVDAQNAQVEKDAAARGLESVLEERVIVAALVERGLEPRLELVRLDSRVSELRARKQAGELAVPRVQAAIEEARSRQQAAERQFRAEASTELSRLTADRSSSQALLPGLADRVSRTEIRAPMKGVVNRLFVSTLGGVIKPGDPVAEIVPADDQLVIEARIRPQDIGFVQVGHPARIKISAYDYTVFGAMDGVVTRISADVVPVERDQEYYMARIETRLPALENNGKKLPVIPGMQAQVDIVTGNKTVLAYITKPVTALKENAFRER